MNPNKSIVIIIAEILPLVLFYLFFTHSNEMIQFSGSYLGKLVAILIILFYSNIHWIYGLFICLFVILYYQTDTVEGMINPLHYHNVIDLNSNNNNNNKNNNDIVKNEFNEFKDMHFSKQFSIIETKLTTQEELTYPKSNDDWVNNVWQTWFSDNHTKPYGAMSMVSEQFALL